MDEKDRMRLGQDLQALQRKLVQTERTIKDYSLLAEQSQTPESLEIIKKRLTLALTEKPRLEQLILAIKWLMED